MSLDQPGGGFGPRHLTPSIWSLTMALPLNTYGVRCEFSPGGQRYTYLVDLPHHGDIAIGADVVVASPKGGYKVIRVMGRTEDLAPVDLKYMKYIVQKVDADFYDTLMHNLLAGDEKAATVSVTDTIDPDRHGEGDMDIARPPTSPLIDEGDVDPPDGDVTRGENVPSNSME